MCVCDTLQSKVCVILLRRRQTNTVQSVRFRAIDEVAVCDINNCESRDAMSQFPAPAVDARRAATCLQCQEDDPGQRAITQYGRLPRTYNECRRLLDNSDGQLVN